MPLRDAAGTLHRRAEAARIVSLVPSLTELVCDLGLASRLVGRTGFCIHPREMVKSVPKVGGTKSVDLDKVRALAPTHALLNIDENEKPLAEALRAFVPQLVVTHPLAPLDNLELYRLLGGIFGAEKAAAALAERFRHAHDDLRAAAAAWPRRRTLYLIWKKPWMTVSRDTYVSRTLALAGLDTLALDAPERYPRLELDAGLLGEADIVLLATEPYRFRERDLAELRALPALRGKSIELIDGEMTCWYGSRAIAAMDYLRRFAQALAT